MALISCPECGNPVSDKAKTCPHCGHEISQHTENYDQNERYTPQKEVKTPPVWLWVIVGLLVGAAICALVLTLGNGNKEKVVTDTIVMQDTVKVDEVDKEEVVEEPKVETPQMTTAEWKRTGRFYGKIGKYPVLGSIDWRGDVPNGNYYYESQGPGSQLDLWCEGDNFVEYDGDNMTGTWEVEHLNLDQKKFMTGTYVRARDGKTFHFELFRAD